MVWRSITAACVALTAGACTSLSTSTDRVANSAYASTGIPYSLPMLQYEVKVTRTLDQCFEANTQNPQLAFSVKVEATPKYVAGETYRIDYRELAGFTKISSLSIENYAESGVLKSINAAAEDRSAQILEGAAGLAFDVIRLAAGVPAIPNEAAPAIPPPPTHAVLVCDEDTPEALEAVTLAAANVKTTTAELKAVTEEIEGLQAQLAAGGLNDAGKGELQDKLKEQEALVLKLSLVQRTLENARKAVSAITELRWPRTFQDRALIDTLPDADFRRFKALLDVQEVPLTAGSEPVCGVLVTVEASEKIRLLDACLRSRLAASLELDSLAPPSGQNRLANPVRPEQAQPDVEYAVSPSSGAEGVFVRPPAPGRLLACQNPVDAQCEPASSRILLRTDDTFVPQLGDLRFLPFRNRMFQNNALSLSLAENGLIEKFSYSEESASGEAAVGSATAIVEAFQTYQDERRTAAGDALTAAREAELEAIQFEIDQLTKQNALDQLVNPPDDTELTTIQTETALVNARLALLQALLAERAAEEALAQASQ